MSIFLSFLAAMMNDKVGGLECGIIAQATFPPPDSSDSSVSSTTISNVRPQGNVPCALFLFRFIQSGPSHSRGVGLQGVYCQ